MSAARWRVAVILTTLMMVVYFGFILLVAFNKPLMGTRIADGLSVGILLGAVVIFAAWALIWVVHALGEHALRPSDRAPPAGNAIVNQTGASALGAPNAIAIGGFLIFVSATLVITYWASRRTKTTEHFYAAGRSITGFQNGLALAGDYMSAASFLGIAGLVALSGFDGLIYSIGFLVGWPIVMFLIAEPLRNLGRYTFADVVAMRLRQVPVRVAAATGSLAVVSFYLIAQMVGAGNLVRLLFGLDYAIAVTIVGVVMLAYVLFGGMIATTWVQIVKAMLLLAGAFLLAMLVLARFNFNPAGAVRHGGGAIRRRRARAGTARVGSSRCRVIGAVADARDGRTAAHPDALLHGAGCADCARLGDLRNRVHRVLLPADFRPGFRRDGAGRPGRDPRHRRRRQYGGAASCRGRRRNALPRIHRGCRVCDDPRRCGRPDPLRCGSSVARSLGARGPSWLG